MANSRNEKTSGAGALKTIQVLYNYSERLIKVMDTGGSILAALEQGNKCICPMLQQDAGYITIKQVLGEGGYGKALEVEIKGLGTYVMKDSKPRATNQPRKPYYGRTKQDAMKKAAEEFKIPLEIIEKMNADVPAKDKGARYTLALPLIIQETD